MKLKNLKVTALAALVGAGLAGCGNEPEVPVTFDHADLDTTGVKTVYGKGETLSTAGLKVTLTYSDGSTEELSGEQLSVTADMNAEVDGDGETEATVSVKFNVGDEEKELTYTITLTSWKAEDLALFDYCSSYVPFFGSFPYLPGMELNAQTQGEGQTFKVNSWNLELEDATNDDFTKYCTLLSKVKSTETVKFKNKDAYFTVLSVDAFDGAAEFAGVKADKVACFELTPYELSSSKKYAYRLTTSDEIIIVGLTEDNKLLVKNAWSNSWFQYNMMQEKLGTSYDGAYYCNSFTSDLASVMEFNVFNAALSEFVPCAAGLITLPDFTVAPADPESTTDPKKYPLNFFDYSMLEPFNSELDDYLFSLGFGFKWGTEAERTAWVNSFTGFTKTTEQINYYKDDSFEKELTDFDVYTFEDDYVGKIVIKVSEYADDFFQEAEGENEAIGGYACQIFYEAPEVVKTVVERFIEQDILVPLGYEPDDVTIVKGQFATSVGEQVKGTTAAQFIGGMVNALGADFILKDYTDEPDEDGFIQARYIAKGFLVTVKCKMVPGEDTDTAIVIVGVVEYTPTDLTELDLGEAISKVLAEDIQFELNTSNGRYEGSYDGYADYFSKYGYSEQTALLPAAFIYQNFYLSSALPAYTTWTKTDLSVHELGGIYEGYYGSEWKFRTNDDKFEVVITAYITVDNEEIPEGIIVDFSIGEPQDVEMPADFDMSECIDNIAASMFGSGKVDSLKQDNCIYEKDGKFVFEYVAETNGGYVSLFPIGSYYSDQDFLDYYFKDNLEFYSNFVPEYFKADGDVVITINDEAGQESVDYTQKFTSVDGNYSIFVSIYSLDYGSTYTIDDFDGDQAEYEAFLEYYAGYSMIEFSFTIVENTVE